MAAKLKLTDQLIEKVKFLQSLGITPKNIGWILDISPASVSRALKMARQLSGG